jgi:hypothetical protein
MPREYNLLILQVQAKGRGSEGGICVIEGVAALRRDLNLSARCPYRPQRKPFEQLPGKSRHLFPGGCIQRRRCGI